MSVLEGYTKKEFNTKNNPIMYKDLNIYGDDLEDIINILSKKLYFEEKLFWKKFEEKNYYNPPEVELTLPKIFYLNISKLFQGSLAYDVPKTSREDISIQEFISIIESLILEGKKQPV
jgi:hypothetical protein